MWIFVLVDGRALCDPLIFDVMDKFQEANKLHLLIDALDTDGRKAINVALEKYRLAFQERMYFYKVYELGLEAHRSATCTLRVAKDHSDNGREVALKFMQHKDQFEQELKAREEGAFIESCVLGIIRSHDSDEDPEFK